MLSQGVKLPCQQEFVFRQILPYWAGFFWYWCFYLLLPVSCPHFPKSNVQKIKIFEILGKRLWKEMFTDFKILLIKGVKCPRQESFLPFAFLEGFFTIGATICISQKMLCLPYAGFFLVYSKYLQKSRDSVCLVCRILNIHFKLFWYKIIQNRISSWCKLT